MKECHQNVLNFSNSQIVYCPKCQIKYNKLNINDSKFHNKIHRALLLPKCSHIGDNFYQHKNVFYLVFSSEIVAKCSGKIVKDTFFITKSMYITNNYKVAMLKALLTIFKTINNL